MNVHSAQLPSDFRRRYGQVARAVGVEPSEPVLVAFSGGADSVLLLELVARAEERPNVVAVHVDHGLRGPESDADASFCERAARRLGVTFVLRRITLDRDAGSLEARAREARYHVLAEEAEARGIRVILTGHHADDALETLLMRWSRGTELGGLSGPRANLRLVGPHFGAELVVARPLLHLRREEVRCMLSSAGIGWREDTSNADDAFTRNRVRHRLLPRIAELAGPEALAHLSDFGRAVERLELDLARATAHLAWRPLDAIAATRPAERAHLGGTLARSELMRLPSALRRRALFRLLQEGCGAPPRKRVLGLVLGDLERARTGRHVLSRGWQLELRPDRLDLVPPKGLLDPRAAPHAAARSASTLASTSAASGAPTPIGECRGDLPFPPPTRTRDVATEAPAAEELVRLPVPGAARLRDGRLVTAATLERAPEAAPPHAPTTIELDADSIDAALAAGTSDGKEGKSELVVRFPRRGDKWKPLGAPGTRSVARFLADAHVPRDERARVPLVIAGGRIAWVVGLRPSDEFRVHAGTRRRLRLSLYGAQETDRRAPRGDRDGRAVFAPGELFTADERPR
ncbi:MAG: tRNA lysidine(34) synthetase TilS [Planctomycetes bacterium]|nr:tRNA lysidine(34) synthetase TilS [Planctomycetota bacterium]